MFKHKEYLTINESVAVVEITAPSTDEKQQYGDKEKESTPLLHRPHLPLYKAIMESAHFAVPFALSRLVTAAQNIANGVLIDNVPVPAVVAAAPVMFMLQQGFTGAARGALSSVNAVVGNLNGQNKFRQIGPAVNQGLLLAVLLGIPTTAIFFTSADWLGLLGLNLAVVRQAGTYLRALSYGIIPTYLSVVDQNFLLSIKRKRAPIMLNTLLVGSSMTIGFPLALLKLGLAGLGYGASAGALITFTAGRLYLYFNKDSDQVLDRHKYSLFSKSFNSGMSFKGLVGLSFPTTLQAISEWLPTTLIALIAGISTNAQETLEAEQPSMQMLLIMNQVLLGLGTAATVAVANTLGRASNYAEQGQKTNELIERQNVKTIGYANLIVTALLTLPPVLICTIYPDPIVSVFSSNANVFPLAKTMLRVTGATLLVDGVRNTVTGALLGKKRPIDNYFTSISNLMITSAAATALGYIFSQDSNLGPLSFFLFRMVGIFVTAMLLLGRWQQGNKIKEVISEEVVTNTEKNLPTLGFKPVVTTLTFDSNMTTSQADNKPESRI